MSMLTNATFSDANYTSQSSWQKKQALPTELVVERGQTQVNVNATVLNYLVQKFAKTAPLKVLDLPCGNMEFLSYIKQLFPAAQLSGVDIVKPQVHDGIEFANMDVSKEFTIPAAEQFDLVTSVSGVMMFSNTKHFMESCIARLKKGGTFIVTNDNSATVKDKLTYLLFGSYRIFKPVFTDKEHMTENVPIQELCRLLRVNNMIIKDIIYTSSSVKDMLLWPVGALLYPLHVWYLSRLQTSVPRELIRKMYPFQHLFCRHYILIAEKL